ncbi:MAG: 2-phospho-L-lactate transferase [Gammaproteobacteria bacterium]|uniref:2-phospho-L-lactate transferase n=1 Tax=OM182 bacterium MED-G24 TaxID=1986255 RepID=A0A2A5WTT5_9GAMM|nr:2-phospho-L-lactate transferase [Gammaproteobacteria bacterium]PDH39647.1 MAG: 2-phospho-L-lactate transferase [OM182 bacterium MED-G24]RPG25513.1 MAG: 2-phospho-L-lactate transferase [Gammaproteobacteria bacterium TMED50]|tara:strand:- start:1703 stop:2656 length:954 start_codon:yes stop_codon:yes gene_type:complete
MNVLALSGGVGGAKLALGLSRCLAPDELTIVANTADDFTHLGLRICPDLDTVMYTLAEISNPEVGWGQQDETWQCLGALSDLGAESWFRLGDRDLATHLVRTERLGDGQTLSHLTEYLCEQLNIQHQLVPMADQSVSTQVDTEMGRFSFQHYFVRERCEPKVTGFEFEGIEQARPSPGFQAALVDRAEGDDGPIVICPSNPFVSVEPMLALPGVRTTMVDSHRPVIAVSPIVGGEALKGPAAKMMAELGIEQSAMSVANYYGNLIDGFVIDTVDAELQPMIEQSGIPTIVTNTVMVTLADRIQLAEDVLSFAATLRS